MTRTMAGAWRPDDYRDTYTDRVKNLIAAKKKGDEITVAEAAPEATNVVDLMSALRASVDAAKQGGRSGERGKTTRPAAKAATAATKAPARKATAKKATAKKATPAKKTATTSQSSTATAKKTAARKAS